MVRKIQRPLAECTHCGTKFMTPMAVYEAKRKGCPRCSYKTYIERYTGGKHSKAYREALWRGCREEYHEHPWLGNIGRACRVARDHINIEGIAAYPPKKKAKRRGK